MAASNPGADPSTPAGDAPAAAMGRAVIKGSIWMAVNSAVTRGASLLAQLVLAWFLTDEHFGIFAIAISISVFATALRDGGVRQLLIQRHAEYDSLVGPVFWMAMAFNLGTALVIAGIAPAARAVYGHDELALILLIIALSVPLSTPGAVLMTRLSIDLRFRELSMIQVWSALVRYAGAVGLAIAGFGPLAFVLPLPAVALVEWFLSYRANRERLWSRPMQPGLWPSLFRQTRWVVLGGFAVGAYNMGNYFAVGLVVEDVAIVGVYYFAYQVVLQFGMLLASNANQVLFPAFSRLTREPERKRQAIVRSLSQVMLIAAPATLALVPLFGPLEQLLFGGRWKEAVLPVQIIAALYPAHVVMAVPYAALQARGAFKAWAVMLLFIALGMILSGIVGAWLSGTPVGIAATVAVFMCIASLLFIIAAFRPVGIGIGRIFAAIMPAWLAAAAGAALALLALQLLPAASHPVIQVLVAGAAFSAVYFVLTRLLLPAQLRDSLAFVPGPLRPVASRFLMLGPPPGPPSDRPL